MTGLLYDFQFRFRSFLEPSMAEVKLMFEQVVVIHVRLLAVEAIPNFELCFLYLKPTSLYIFGERYSVRFARVNTF